MPACLSQNIPNNRGLNAANALWQNRAVLDRQSNDIYRSTTQVSFGAHNNQIYVSRRKVQPEFISGMNRTDSNGVGGCLSWGVQPCGTLVAGHRRATQTPCKEKTDRIRPADQIGRKSTKHWNNYWTKEWEGRPVPPGSPRQSPESNRFELGNQQKLLAPITMSIDKMANGGRDLSNLKGAGFLIGASKELGMKGAETHSPVDKWWMKKITRGHINITH